MHSARADLSRAIALLLACWACACACTLARAQDGAASAPAAPPPASAAADAAARAARIAAAVARLDADPLLSGKHKEHRLHWVDDEDNEMRPGSTRFLEWLKALAASLSDMSRFLFWGIVLVAVAVLLVTLRRVVHVRAFRRRAAAEAAVSHVRDLDVRPESLPDDVGGAAWALWQAGQVPAALSLLYRGALSRLIHRFRVPITGSATEGECLALAGDRLPAPALRYVTQVVRAWEANTYGGRSLSLAMGETLCGGFGPRLDASEPRAAEGGA
jgi:hypothetical protein